MRIAIVLLALLHALPTGAAPCSARSSDATAVLVELYTSEGCSSCPPADRWLSGVGRTYAPEQVVPIALHVDYWDYLGWKDPYAKRPFSQRQRTLSQLQRMALVYTPQVLLQGADFRRWATSDFDAAVQRINARRARANLQLDILSLSHESMRMRARAEVSAAARLGDHALYIATYENRVESRVTAGENEGRSLSHDHVVLEWRGPFPLRIGTPFSRELDLPLLPRAKPGDSGVVAFVQDRGTAEVLQALALGACGS